MAIAIVRLRGTQNLNPKVRDTLKYLRLNRINHCVVLPNNATTVGMLKVAKDYVTWGEMDAETLAEAIRARGRLVGDQPITDAYVKKHTGAADINAWAAAIVAGKANYAELPEVKPLLRLHPARSGLEGIKRSVENGGALGYRGEEINTLIRRMC
jgi:large subunit ribosomal protein L30